MDSIRFNPDFFSIYGGKISAIFAIQNGFKIYYLPFRNCRYNSVCHKCTENILPSSHISALFCNNKFRVILKHHNIKGTILLSAAPRFIVK